MSMHDDLLETYKKYVNYSNEERVSLGKDYLENIVGELRKIKFDNKQIEDFIVSTFKYFVSADKDMTTPEYELFKGITGFTGSEEYFYCLTNHGSDSEFMARYEFNSSRLSRHGRLAIIYFALLILSSDDKISAQEQIVYENYIKKIII